MTYKYLLSFIVPFYNVELYIEQCIRSLCNQDLEHEKYEIIVIDDCSEDKSAEIVKNLQKEFPFIKLINMPINSKTGSARNKGVLESQGKYIWFVDPDDFIENNVLSNLLELMEKDNLDILHFNYQRIYNNKEIIPYSTHYNIEIITGVNFFFEESELWWKKCVEVWRRIHKKSFLLENNFKFAENVMYEDTDYSIEMFSVPSKIRHLDFSPYYYRCNLDSITKSAITPKHLEYWIFLSKRCDKLRVKIIEERRDLRFIKILNDFITYQLDNVYKYLSSFDGGYKNEYQEFIKNLDTVNLRRYMSFRKYFFLKYPKLFTVL